MDDQRFDNIARRLGRFGSRRDALRTAGFGTFAAFTAIGLQRSVLAQEVTIENHCRDRGVACNNREQCCGFRKKKKNEIVCRLSNAGPGERCCGATRASCFNDDDCCLNYFCNMGQECALL